MNEFACFGFSIAAISYTISTHKASHQRVRIWQQNVYFRVISVVIYVHTAGFKNRRRTFCAKCILILLVRIEIINIHKLVTTVTHYFLAYVAFIRLLCGAVGLFQSAGPARGAPSQAEHRNLATSS